MPPQDQSALAPAPATAAPPASVTASPPLRATRVATSAADGPAIPATPAIPAVDARGVNIFYGTKHAVIDATLQIPARAVTAMQSSRGRRVFVRDADGQVFSVRHAELSQ